MAIKKMTRDQLGELSAKYAVAYSAPETWSELQRDIASLITEVQRYQMQESDDDK